MSLGDHQRKLAQAERDLALARRKLPSAIAMLSAKTPSGWPTSSSFEGTTGAEVSDSTGNAAVQGLPSRTVYWQIDMLVQFVASKMKQLAELVEAVPTDVDVTKEAERIRCSGGEGVWADLTCTRNSVRTVESESGQRISVCWACIARRRRMTQS